VDKLEVSTARSLRHPATKNLPMRGVKHYIAFIRVYAAGVGMVITDIFLPVREDV
jgi:hypothetical protein